MQYSHMTIGGGNRNRMASKYPTETEIAETLLSTIHTHVSATLGRIEAIEAEIRAQIRSSAPLRTQQREQARQWFESHPQEARAIAALFGFPSGGGNSHR